MTLMDLDVDAPTNKALAATLNRLQPLAITDQGAYCLDQRYNYWRLVPNQDLRTLILHTFEPYRLFYYREPTKAEQKAEPGLDAVRAFLDMSHVARFRDLEIYLRHAPEFQKPGFFGRGRVGFTCRNGFVDCSGTRPVLVRAIPEQASRFFLDTDFDPEARCPYTQEVINSFFVEDADNDGPGKRRALLEFFAMCFLGRINADKRGRILWVTGEPGTGKSTLIDSLIKAVFPPEFLAMVDPKSFGEPQQLLDLVGKSLNFADEVDEKTITNAAIIRKVVAGNEMKVRQLYKGFFNARMPAGHIMVANLMPRQADESGALIDRTIHLHFTHRFKRRNESAEEVTRQIVAERAGIINLLLETYFEIKARPPELQNVQAPESAKRRRQEMLEDANIFKQFVKILKPNPEAKRRATDLLKAFNLFKGIHGYSGGPNLTSGVLAKKVLELKPELKVGESGGAAWYGFDVVDESGQVELPRGELN